MFPQETYRVFARQTKVFVLQQNFEKTVVQVQYSYTMFPKEVFGVRIDLQVIFVVKKVSNYASFRHFLVTQVTIVNKFFTYSLLLYAKKLYVLCSYKLIKNT